MYIIHELALIIHCFWVVRNTIIFIWFKLAGMRGGGRDCEWWRWNGKGGLHSSYAWQFITQKCHQIIWSTWYHKMCTNIWGWLYMVGALNVIPSCYLRGVIMVMTWLFTWACLPDLTHLYRLAGAATGAHRQGSAHRRLSCHWRSLRRHLRVPLPWLLRGQCGGLRLEPAGVALVLVGG